MYYICSFTDKRKMQQLAQNKDPGATTRQVRAGRGWVGVSFSPIARPKIHSQTKDFNLFVVRCYYWKRLPLLCSLFFSLSVFGADFFVATSTFKHF